MFQKETINQKLVSLFGCFRQTSASKLVIYLQNSNKENLANILSTIELDFLELQKDGCKIAEVSIADDFLQLLVKVIDWGRITSEPKYACVYSIIIVLCAWYPAYLLSLLENDIIKALVKILKQEHSSGVTISHRVEGGETITTANVISLFLPALSSSPCFEDVNTLAKGILFSGRHSNEHGEEYETKNILTVLEAAFRPVYNICWQTDSLPIHKVLLLKMIYWANAIDVLERFLVVQTFASFLCSSISSEAVVDVVMGTAIMHVMVTKHAVIFNEPRFLNAIQHAKCFSGPESNDGRPPWMIEFHDVLLSAERDEQGELDLIGYCFGNETFSVSVQQKSKLIRLILEFILPHLKGGTGAGCDLSVCYSRLAYFIQKILKLPENAKTYKGQLTVQSGGIENFERLVYFISCTIDDLQESYKKSIDSVVSINESDPFLDSKEPIFFCLGLYRSPSLERVLGDSTNQTEINCNPMAQALKLLTILHEININWGVLFCTLTQGRLIDNDSFRSLYLDDFMNKQLKRKHRRSVDIPARTVKFAMYYPFLLSYSVREQILDHLIYKEDENADKITLTVPRRNIIEFLEENFKLDQIHRSDDLSFQFKNEMGSGPGPTKEFYSKFSLECQRHDFNIWIGEAAKGADDQLYSSSTCGLFPAPYGKARDSTLEVIGCFMAKSIWEERPLDINFSPAFYKILFNPNNQPVTLNDIKDVMPNIFEFLKGLVNAYREKNIIMEDNNLTPEEKSKAISEITCNGSSFDDLYLNFTVPGFPGLEMMEGGSDISLTIENIDKYLMMLVFSLLFTGPKKTFGKIRTAFDRFLPISFMKLIFPYEMEQLVSGLTAEHWTVDYLRKCCHIKEGLSVDTPIVRDLFEILSSLSPNDQRLFLQFVTSSPRLPAGGLKYLDPPLTIKRSGSEACLPSSMTCFNTLFVGDSVGKEVLEEKLLIAIREGADSFQFI